MARRGPSLTALLGLLAVAGYQNRDKLSELIGKVQAPDSQLRVSSGLGEQLTEMLGGSPTGSRIAAALNELMAMFQGTPNEKPAQSWVAQGTNTPLEARDLEEALGEETLADLVEKTGMSRASLLSALAINLPSSIDVMTPNGRLPSDDEARGYI